MSNVFDKKRGFTMIELLVVVAIIGILAAVVIGFVSESQSSGRDAKRNRDTHEIRTALDLYKTDNGFYPTEGNENFVTVDGTDYMSTALVEGGHISSVATDPLNVAPQIYQYRPVGTGYEFQFCPENQEDCVILEP